MAPGTASMRNSCRSRRWPASSANSADPVLEMRDAGRLDRSELLELWVADVFEQAVPGSEEEGDDVEADLVEEAGG